MRKTFHWLGQLIEDTVQEQLRTDLEFSLWREEVEQLWPHYRTNGTAGSLCGNK